MPYLDWHYFYVWPKILSLWLNLTLFPFFYFAIPYHLATLFSPWKRQEAVKGVGFDLGEFLGRTGFNLIALGMGIFVRSTVIIFGFFFMLVFLILGIFPVVLWVLTPGLTLPLYLWKKNSLIPQAKLILDKSDHNLKKLLTLLLKTEEGRFWAIHLGIDYQKLTAYLRQQENWGDFHLLEKKLATKKNMQISDILAALFETSPVFKNILGEKHIKVEDVRETARWFERLKAKKTPPLLFDLKRIKSLPGIGLNWAYGYTVELDQYSKDLTHQYSSFPLLVGREKELGEMERILLKRSANNVLVVGEPGVGRHILVETLANRILGGYCHPTFSGKRILSVNMHLLASARPSILEVKGLCSEILEEAQNAGNIIIVIDEIDKFVSVGEGRIDLSDVFAKFAQSSVGLIGITNPRAYHKYIEINSSLAPLFEKIEIAPPTLETVINELEVSVVPVLERQHQVIITYPAIKKTIEDADRYVSSTPFPAKAIELLDQSAVFTLTKKKQNILLPAFIDEFLSEKFHISLGDLQKSEREKLARLETLIHQRVINQTEAVHTISAALRRGRLNVSSAKKPIGSFLFLGPTGVGKTETAKALSSVYFGQESALLRFDMSQYQKEEGLERLIGSAKLGLPGELTSKLIEKPFALLLLDEFEKAEKGIYNLFLTLLDEGYLLDASGKKVDARNIIIIATSNAGAEFIRESISQGITGHALQKALLEYVQKQQIFSPELLNRFDAVTVFTPLSEGNVREVAKLMLLDLNKRLSEKEISVHITPYLIKKLASAGFDPQFGARSMRRLITETIEDQVAQRLLSGSVGKGEKIEIEI